MCDSGEKIVHLSLMFDIRKIILPHLRIKLGLMKSFENEMNKYVEAFRYLRDELEQPASKAFTSVLHGFLSSRRAEDYVELAKQPSRKVTTD
ncbi:hypothetical protein PR048_022358 [Dryococelus australis]|uniref:Uncharacterized protein n=1 Tax=Dryococelus australis TaxID=614101 RepID=A0ABQ9H0U9_9NEOP|nr:hypothetical protein PR048_022358 [Dryococelus australis]